MSPVLGTLSPSVAGVIGNGYAVPAGWGDLWRGARNNAGTTRTEAAIFGDSTTLGSGANYSWVQRLRDRSVAAGYADGGKGTFGQAESLIGYDSPEINGTVSNGWTWGQDAALTDIIAGEGFSSNTNGEVLTVQGKIVGSGGVFRLWYVNRAAGSFTYAVDGGGPVTVNTTASSHTPAFVQVTGLAAGTHTVVITNTAAAIQIVVPCFMNGTGVAYQKYARSGQTMYHYFDPLGRFAGSRGSNREQYTQSLLGLSPGAAAQGTNLAWQRAASAVTGHPVVSLAILHLGFNDFGAMSTPWNASVAYVTNNRVTYGDVQYVAIASSTNIAPPTDAAKWTQSEGLDLDGYQEGIHQFCRLAQAAQADPVVISGEFSMQATNEAAYLMGGRIAALVRSTALACGAAWCDFMFPALGRPNSITGQASTNNPHLNKPGYVAQADFLWDKVLSL